MKKTITLALALALGITGLQAQYSGGEGTESSPYVLKTAEDLKAISTTVSGGSTCEGQYFVLGNDIKWDSSTDFPMIGYTGKSTPLKFAGVIDGKGYKIDGLKLNGTYYTAFISFLDTKGAVKNLTFANPVIEAKQSYGGVVAANLQGTIDNVKVLNVSMTSPTGGFKGGICGFVKAGTISNCEITGSINTSVSTGGIVGQNYGTVKGCHSSVTIVSQTDNSASVHIGGIASVTLYLNNDAIVSDCVFDGSIQGGSLNNVGGITGTLTNGIIERTMSSGYISATGTSGGLVGTFSNGGIIRDCIFNGTLYNNVSAGGGLIGNMGTLTAGKVAEIKNCLSTGCLFIPTLLRNEYSGLVGSGMKAEKFTGCYYDDQITGFFKNEMGKPTAELTDGSPLTGYDTETWTFTKGLYPRLKSIATDEVSVLYATPVFLASGQTRLHVTSDFTVGTANDVEWELSGSTVTKLSGDKVRVVRTEKVQNLVLTSYLGNYSRRMSVNVAPKIFAGDGTESSPFIIANAEDMIKLKEAVNKDLIDFQGEYLALANDIDMAGKEFEPLCFNTSTPMAFAGVLDGKGHSIKNLSLDALTNKVMNVAFTVNLAASGTIKNLTIDKSCKFKYYRNAASFVTNNYGTLENCRNHAEINTTEGYSGGLVTFAKAGSKIVSCLNTGKVSSSEKNGALGGIVYSAEAGSEISGCVNTGDITANLEKISNLGGIAGYSYGVVKDCYNAGMITVGKNASQTGGILAYDKNTTELSRCLNTGAIVAGGTSNVAALVGNPKGIYTDNYADIQMSVFANTTTGLNMKTTEELISGSFKGLGENWQYSAGSYPVPKALAKEGAVILAKSPVMIGGGKIRNLIDTNTKLTEVEGLKWTLSEGPAFTLNGNTVTFKAPEAYVIQNLTGAYEDYTKTIPLGAQPALFTGEGTESSPWLISSSKDLVKLSEFSAGAGVTFSGNFFKVTADIDMTEEKEFNSIGEIYVFSGTFDGNNHKVDNLNKEGDNLLGLFGTIGGEGTVKNLTIGANSKFSGAGFVGSVASRTQGKIENCVNNASVKSTGATTGGIVGEASQSASLVNLKNYGNVTSTSQKTGGIVGAVTSQDVTLKTLENHGAIEAKGSYSGGIIGHSSAAVTLSDCVNYGNVTGATDAAGVMGYAGGVATITSVRNYGEIHGTTEVGGLAGYLSKNNSKISNSFNAGEVTATTSTAGGVLGRGLTVTFEACANVGDVTNSKANLSTSTAGAGGIAGKCDPTMTNCYNTGTITAGDNVGAAVGLYNSTTSGSINNFYSTGAVKATNSSPAGTNYYAGKKPAKLVMNNCYYDRQVLPELEADGGKTTTELMGLNFGENFISDNEGYPVIKAYASDNCLGIWRTALVFGSTEENYNNVKNGFEAAMPEGVSLGGDDVFTINGNKVAVPSLTQGTYALTVTKGNASRTITLKLDTEKQSSGVEDGIIEGEEPISVRYYNLSGAEISEPNASDGVVIKKAIYSNGRSATTKIVPAK